MFKLITLIVAFTLLCTNSFADVVSLGSDKKQNYYYVPETLKYHSTQGVQVVIITDPFKSFVVKGHKISNMYSMIVSCSSPQYYITGFAHVDQNGTIMYQTGNIINPLHTVLKNHPVMKIQKFCNL